MTKWARFHEVLNVWILLLCYFFKLAMQPRSSYVSDKILVDRKLLLKDKICKHVRGSTLIETAHPGQAP